MADLHSEATFLYEARDSGVLKALCFRHAAAFLRRSRLIAYGYLTNFKLVRFVLYLVGTYRSRHKLRIL
jgi:hypothetical protein